MMTQPRDVVITGLGVVSPIGIGRDQFAESLRQQRGGILVRDGLENSEMAFRLAAEVKDFDAKKYVKPRKSLKVMCREIQFAFATASMAMEEAGLAIGQIDPDRIGVVLGSELYYCKIEDLEDVYRNCCEDGEFIYERWGERAMSDIYPLWMLKHLPNMPACHIGIAFDARAHNNTMVSEETSSLDAIIEACRVIQRGRADVMVAGGTGARISMARMAFHGERGLSRRIHDPRGASRPFDASRDGMVAGEGASSFLLESRQHAEARGATIHGTILGYGQGHNVPAGGEKCLATQHSIAAALRASSSRPDEIGHVNADGRGAIDGDRAEALAIRETLGDVPVTAPRSFFGYLGAGSGAVEMAASIVSLSESQIPVTLNYTQPDPDCPVNVVHDSPTASDKRTAMIVSRTLTGRAAVVVLGGPE